MSCKLLRLLMVNLRKHSNCPSNLHSNHHAIPLFEDATQDDGTQATDGECLTWRFPLGSTYLHWSTEGVEFSQSTVSKYTALHVMDSATPPRRVIDLSWTTDNDPNISHSRPLGHGGSGHVHEVLCRIIVPDT
jgi:hypothetical protein